jgi:cell division protein FtsI/penicillin-binding protein 2
MSPHHPISVKTNRVLNFILLALLLILMRIWYLTVLQKEELLQAARRPQRRTVVEQVERATIRDRFNIPLALNKIKYNAAVLYTDLRQIPSVQWKKDEKGKKRRVYPRLEYIKNLSSLLGEQLFMDPLLIEDLIHSKASLFPHLPFVIKEDIPEKHYYRLKMLEKEWLGIQMQRSFKRFYPQGKTAADVIGYMGAINEKEHLALAKEIQELKIYLQEREDGMTPFLPKGFNSPFEVRERLKQLEEKSYTMNDFIGKAGVEAAFDQSLRGFYGKKAYEVDVKGNILRELPGTRKAVSGHRIILSLSSELQECAEALLASHESKELKPWIKGGAIVAMLPSTGEVVALASYPRFDPNDFIPNSDPSAHKKMPPSLSKWLESEAYIADVWNGSRPLEKELYSLEKNTFFEETQFLTWEIFLEMILPRESPVRKNLDKLLVKDVIHLETLFNTLFAFSKQKTPKEFLQWLEKEEIPEREKQLKEELISFLSTIPSIEDKLLFLDLCRLVIRGDAVSRELLSEIENQSLSSFRASAQIVAQAEAKIRPVVQKIFHETDFQEWRDAHFKDFLHAKRYEEKAEKKYPRPYLYYLDLMEKKLFKEFWEKHRLLFLDTYFSQTVRFASSHYPHLYPYTAPLLSLEQTLKEKDLPAAALAFPSALEFYESLRPFSELGRPLLGQYRHVRSSQGVQLEKHLASSFYPLSGFGYGRSQAYRQSTPQGSVFKLVVAYEALKEKYQELLTLSELNPLTLIDDLRWTAKPGDLHQVLGFHLNGEPIQRLYKGGRLPRSSHPQIGKVDLLGAIEQSSNIYFSLLASDVIEEPSLLTNSAAAFGFGERTGIELPYEIPGSLPSDVSHNRTGLYSFAIGQHSLVVTPLQTAVMLSAIANKGEILTPKMIKLIAGKEPSQETEELFSLSDFPFKHPLSLIGIQFPLFTESLSNLQRPYLAVSPKQTKRHLFFPDKIRNMLLEGMRRVIIGERGTARHAVLKGKGYPPQVLRDYLDLQNQLVGKTGTAEILYKQTVDAHTQARIEKHVWFGGISFTSAVDNSFTAQPELVIIVYLRFGGGGKEAAPLAAKLVKKWREICAKRLSSH